MIHAPVSVSRSPHEEPVAHGLFRAKRAKAQSQRPIEYQTRLRSTLPRKDWPIGSIAVSGIEGRLRVEVHSGFFQFGSGSCSHLIEKAPEFCLPIYARQAPGSQWPQRPAALHGPPRPGVSAPLPGPRRPGLSTSLHGSHRPGVSALLHAPHRQGLLPACMVRVAPVYCLPRPGVSVPLNDLRHQGPLHVPMLRIATSLPIHPADLRT